MKWRRTAAPIERVYAIGDVHGRHDLFAQLVRIIERDQAGRPPAATKIVLLGNIVDRGPRSAEMVRGCMTLTAATDRFVVLKGSSEDLMVRGLRGDLLAYGDWLEGGGRATLRSWGLPRRVADGPALPDNARAAAEMVGEDVLRWLAKLPLHDQFEDFLFVHAGIRPGVPLQAQHPDDLLWGDDDFLFGDAAPGPMVVHGHATDESGAVFRPGRIGIDTGAWRSERLTALGIQAGETWTLNTAAPLMSALMALHGPARAGAAAGARW